MTNDEMLAARRRLIGRNVSTGYRRPVQLVRGSMQYLFDADGRRYIDGYNNVPHVGHCHPRVVDAAERQMRAHTRRRDLIVLDAAYHGNTTTLIDASPYKFNGPGGAGRPPWVHVVPVPDVYRGAYR